MSREFTVRWDTPCELSLQIRNLLCGIPSHEHLV